ncbi:MAG: 2-dehydro-3-deoxyphosphogluconate aldolase, partial [Firmicutes bacterium]|nr:2-dehydro-3-deoxyphosphogluconate aldolase [Bacillota bacterium]
MTSNAATERLAKAVVIPVIRADSGDKARSIARALVRAGLQAIEVTFTVPGADRV